MTATVVTNEICKSVWGLNCLYFSWNNSSKKTIHQQNKYCSSGWDLGTRYPVIVTYSSWRRTCVYYERQLPPRKNFNDKCHFLPICPYCSHMCLCAVQLNWDWTNRCETRTFSPKQLYMVSETMQSRDGCELRIENEAPTKNFSHFVVHSGLSTSSEGFLTTFPIRFRMHRAIFSVLLVRLLGETAVLWGIRTGHQQCGKTWGVCGLSAWGPHHFHMSWRGDFLLVPSRSSRVSKLQRRT